MVVSFDCITCILISHPVMLGSAIADVSKPRTLLMRCEKELRLYCHRQEILECHVASMVYLLDAIAASGADKQVEVFRSCLGI